jgi:DNA-directed RNA polymerase subunit RPC12/RpoP
MKHALDPSDRLIEASAQAPAQARCPHCGAPVILRRRQPGNRSQEMTYFWRHQDHANPDCSARFSPRSKGKA